VGVAARIRAGVAKIFRLASNFLWRAKGQRMSRGVGEARSPRRCGPASEPVETCFSLADLTPLAVPPRKALSDVVGVQQPVCVVGVLSGGRDAFSCPWILYSI
jgi:hypothetical protein